MCVPSSGRTFLIFWGGKMEIVWWIIMMICGAAICFFGMQVITFPFIALAEFIQRRRKTKDPNFRSQVYEPSSDKEFKSYVVQFVVSLIIVSVAYFGVFTAHNGIEKIAEERSANDHFSSSESYAGDNVSNHNSSSNIDDDGPIPHIEREPYYVLNTSTGKYHRPACGIGGRISDSNRSISYESSEEINARGYSPCGKCCP